MPRPFRGAGVAARNEREGHGVSDFETDYLVIGAGAAGLAFADALVAQGDAHVTLVDRRGLPGGHWNDAYPFVTLHQPAAFYGVASLPLGSGRKDSAGLNAGLYELASGPEICGYYRRVLDHVLLPTGRVRWMPMSEVHEDGRIECLVSGAVSRVTVRRRVVDAGYGGPRVPSTHTRGFEVAAGVRCVAPNALPGLAVQADGAPVPRRFVVLGAGKTAMDACTWLLQTGVEPDAITWVVPRDAWLIDRTTTQNAPEFFEQAIGGQSRQMQAFAEASSLDDLFLRLEACGALMRLDQTRLPRMFHLATMSRAEVELLRRIRHVVRLGRVRRLDAGAMTLDEGRVEVDPQALFVDCTASAVYPRPTQPIFQPGRIVLQLVRLPQPTFSAAVCAWVEAHVDDDASRNRLCRTVPFPYRTEDYPRSMALTMMNQAEWSQHAELRAWMRQCRLDGFGRLMAEADRNDPAVRATLDAYRQSAMGAMANIEKLMAARRAAPA
jgi:hypothetical protein